MELGDLQLIYPGSSLSELTTLGETEIDRRFETLKAKIRTRMDGSPDSELPRIKAQVLLVAEIQATVIEQLRKKQPVQSQKPPK